MTTKTKVKPNMTIMQDRQYGYEWYECLCCGEQGEDTDALDSLPDPSNRRIKCGFCSDIKCDELGCN